MHRSLTVGYFVAMLAAVSSLSAAPRAHAAPPMIQQCIAPDGTTLYTDKPCRSIGARSIPMRGELATRLVREQRTEARYTGVEVSYITYDTGTMRAAREAIGRRHASGGCARTPSQLAMDLRGSFALGDVNRVAESFHWVGMSQRSANATMNRLQRMARMPLVDAQYYDISGWVADAGGGVMQLRFGDDARARIEDLDVRQYAGCWFVAF